MIETKDNSIQIFKPNKCWFKDKMKYNNFCNLTYQKY